MSLKQSSKDSTNPKSVTADSDRDCWRRERDCTCLKVDASADETFVFPYQHFLSAQHARAAGEETIKLLFGITKSSSLEGVSAKSWQLSRIWLSNKSTPFRRVIASCRRAKALG